MSRDLDEVIASGAIDTPEEAALLIAGFKVLNDSNVACQSQLEIIRQTIGSPEDAVGPYTGSHAECRDSAIAKFIHSQEFLGLCEFLNGPHNLGLFSKFSEFWTAFKKVGPAIESSGHKDALEEISVKIRDCYEQFGMEEAFDEFVVQKDIFYMFSACPGYALSEFDILGAEPSAIPDL